MFVKSRRILVTQKFLRRRIASTGVIALLGPGDHGRRNQVAVQTDQSFGAD